ncbi:MAG: DinB family protein [Pirellulaceae bacterium]|nr:DinB family protein [Pirellulaceae bacterium]
MTIFVNHIQAYRFNRTKTLALLDKLEQDGNIDALGWRPGAGRAHIAWQLIHIGVTEEIFATDRLNPSRAGSFPELWPRFRGGSTPDDNIPSIQEIRSVLQTGREHLLETLEIYDESRLNEIPPSLKERGLTVLDVLHILSWHESHHHGQSHLTYNLFRAQKA